MNKFEEIYQREIKDKQIDEFTNSHLENISRANNCIPDEFKDYILTEKGFQVFQHPAGFYIFQRPNLNFQKLVDTIVHYHTRTNLDYPAPPHIYKTLYEIASAYNTLNLSKDGYSFSMEYILESFKKIVY